MPFYPNLPQPGHGTDANVMRAQLNALNDKIDAIPAGPPGDAGPLTADLDANGHNLVNGLSLAFGRNSASVTMD